MIKLSKVFLYIMPIIIISGILPSNLVNASNFTKELDGGLILAGYGDGDGEAEVYPGINYFDVGCLVYTEIDTELPNYTSRIVYFEKEDYDPDDMHSCIEDKHIINIKLSGKYLLTSRAVWSTHSYVGGRHVGFFRVRDGATTEIFWECTSTISGQQLKQLTNVTCELLAGDKVYMKGYQTSGVTMYFLTGDYWDTRFGVQRIGIGGDKLDLNVTLNLELSMYVFIATLVLLIVAITFKRSPFLSLGVFCGSIALAILPDFTETAFQNIVWPIMAWSILATIKRFINWEGE